MRRFVVIDSNALIHRAYHALPPLTDSQGRTVQGVYGFCLLLLKAINDLKPDYIAAAFDLPAPTFRHKAFDGYKATRVKAPDDLYAQIPITKDVVRAFGIPVLEMAGFEADYIIGTIVEKFKDKRSKIKITKQKVKISGVELVILTGDLDTLQLVGPGVQVYTLRKGMSDTITYDEKRVSERFPSLKPEQVLDLKGLMGDPSDNIPGVKGIGEKTALMLIHEFGSIEVLYQELNDFKKRGRLEKSKKLTRALIEKLRAGYDSAVFSKALATIRTDVPLEITLDDARWPGNFDLERAKQILYGLGFRSLINRLPQQQTGSRIKNPSFAKASEGKHELGLATQLTQKSMGQEVRSKGGVATNAVFLATNALDNSLLDVTYHDGSTETLDANGLNSLKERLADEQTSKLCHNVKQVFHLLSRQGLELKGIGFDTALAAYLLDPGRRDYSLESLFYTYAKGPFSLVTRLKERLTQTEQEKLYYERELPLAPVLARMEQNGVKVDAVILDKLTKKVVGERDALWNKIIARIGQEVNLNSPHQLSHALFEILKLSTEKIRKTKEGHISTSESELMKLKGEHPIIDEIFEFRELDKLVTTYLEPFPTYLDKTGRIHPTFNQMVTATGRLSSERPNLQNIPQKGTYAAGFRRAFVSEAGFELLAADYSQIELRIAATLAGDEVMLDAFRRGDDIHARTAAEIFGAPIDKVPDDLRRMAKTVNFGVLYGLSAHGLAQSIQISHDDASKFIEKYFVRFPKIKDYISRTVAEAKNNGFVTNALGRRRPIPELKASNPFIRAQGERMAINFPIQSLQADIIKLAMIKIDALIRRDFKDKARMLLQIHDELVFEVKKEVVREFGRQVAKIMSSAHQLAVPIEVSIESGPNWADLKPISE